ncbi:MAG: hypothetical protein C0520_09315 [Sphingopyxis sp.]|nr:hypothetical protein [Sphingopyxis sp.]
MCEKPGDDGAHVGDRAAFEGAIEDDEIGEPRRGDEATRNIALCIGPAPRDILARKPVAHGLPGARGASWRRRDQGGLAQAGVDLGGYRRARGHLDAKEVGIECARYAEPGFEPCILSLVVMYQQDYRLHDRL